MGFLSTFALDLISGVTKEEKTTDVLETPIAMEEEQLDLEESSL